MYVKLFEDIIHSSLWAQDSDTCKVWITMLTMCDKDGFLNARAPGISGASRVPLDRVREILAYFADPDPDSRTSDHEGRRVEDTGNGYQILNYKLFRELHDAAHQRERNREKQQRYRDRNRLVTDSNRRVTENNPITEAEAYTDQDQIIYAESESESGLLPNVDPYSVAQDDFVAAWNSMRERCETPVGSEMPKCTKGGTKRSAALRTRLKEATFREHWREALDRIPESPFLCGHGKEGWMANPEWFLRPDKVTELLEGKYANGKFSKTDRACTRREGNEYF